MNTPKYFKPARALPNGAPVPPPLRHSVRRAARFDETDPLGVVWHGRYASYFEDARVAFGQRYGLGYQEMYDADIVAPIKQLRIDYDAPLRFGQECRITAVLFWNDAARLDFEYAIHALDGKPLTRGCSVQLFLTRSGELYYAKPDLYEAFCVRWRAGELRPEI